MMLLEARHRQDGSMMFATLATLVFNMRHLQMRCDTYNTCNDDTCNTIGVILMCNTWLADVAWDDVDTWDVCHVSVRFEILEY
jgi:hypothetical protein